MQDAAGGFGYHKSVEEEKSSRYSQSAITQKEELKDIIKGGQISIVEGERTDYAYEAFSKLAKNGYKGLAIVRSNPVYFKKDHGLEAPVHWLCSSNSVKGSILPAEFASRTLNYIREFIADNPKGIILLEGLEYLSNQISFDHVIRWYQLVSDEVKVNSKLKFVVTYDPIAIDEKKVHQIRKESIDITDEINKYFEDLKK